MKKYSISIIIITYNNQFGLVRLLDSLTKVKEDNFEVLVVNDQKGQSLDNIIGLYKKKLDIRWLPSQVSGRPGARNTGARNSHAELLLFLDDDMEITPGFLKTHYEKHQMGSDLVVIGKIEPALNIKSLWNVVLDRRFINQTISSMKNPDDLDFTSVFTGNLSVKRTTFEILGGFDELTFANYGGEDFDFGIRCIEHGVKIKYAPDALAYHHENKMTLKRFLEKQAWSAASMVNLVKKHPKLAARPRFLEINCSVPWKIAEQSVWWKIKVKKMLMVPPLMEILLLFAEYFWNMGAKSLGLQMALWGSRFYYQRHFCQAVYILR